MHSNISTYQKSIKDKSHLLPINTPTVKWSSATLKLDIFVLKLIIFTFNANLTAKSGVILTFLLKSDEPQCAHVTSVSRNQQFLFTASSSAEKAKEVSSPRCERLPKVFRRRPQPHSGLPVSSEGHFNHWLLDRPWQLRSIPGKSAITLMDE